MLKIIRTLEAAIEKCSEEQVYVKNLFYMLYGGPSLPIKKKKPTKLSWPVSAKSDKTFFIQKEKKQNYHGP